MEMRKDSILIHEAHSLNMQAGPFKLLATMTTRISYQLGQSPDLLRVMMYGPPITPDHNHLQVYLRQLIGIAMRSMLDTYNGDIADKMIAIEQLRPPNNNLSASEEFTPDLMDSSDTD